VIELWMYPQITPLIRAAIKRRYELLPYIYSLMLESHMTASPPQRWTGWGYESDPEVWSPRLKSGEEQYWLGPTLLIGGVYESGKQIADIYLPRVSSDLDAGFINLNPPYQYLEAGQWVRIASLWTESIPILAKIGGAIPVGKNVQTRDSSSQPTSPSTIDISEDDYRAIEIFPPQGSSGTNIYRTTWFEDDGISANPEIAEFRVEYFSTDTKVHIGLRRMDKASYKPAWKEADVILPVGDSRTVVSVGDGGRQGSRVLDDTGVNGRGRKVCRGLVVSA
jgi:alpha-glucosidase (family GH31 glycosyl hydrolase)